MKFSAAFIISVAISPVAKQKNANASGDCVKGSHLEEILDCNSWWLYSGLSITFFTIWNEFVIYDYNDIPNQIKTY
ncbi:MAG TPA: hypothetical protein VER14_00240 [Phototrophicaceae bacterium]|nr:hypothetical protein [Phototrophicaceae bacterium]